VSTEAPTPSNIFVTGGTGLIGGEVIVRLMRGGHRVRALVRAPSAEQGRRRLLARLRKSPEYTAGQCRLVRAIPGDSMQELFGVSPADLAGVRTIIHCAANTQFAEREDDRVWRTNVDGARNLVALARLVSPSPRIIFVSTASVVTAPEASCLAEDTPYGGHANTYTRSKREAEAIIRDSGLDAVILRPSIVLSRGLRDRALARSILWAVLIMAELGDVPIDPDAHIDLVPVDYVARAIVDIGLKPSVSHRVYHISAGSTSQRFTEICAAMNDRIPTLGRIRPVGRNAPLVGRAQRLLRPLEAYLPFINANVRYTNDRLAAEIGPEAAIPPPAVTYVPELVGFISLNEALAEMYRP
jgi:nucleoside-diphosphate-sugar epimerase